MRFLALVGSVLIAGSSCRAASKEPVSLRNRPPQAGRGLNIYSRTREVSLGRDLARDLNRTVRLIEDPIVTEYVNRIAQSLAEESGSPFTLRVSIIRAEEANSLALPGGFIYINSGFIRATTGEAELAAALAHEIGHVVARHYTRQASCGDILGVASVTLLFLGGWPGLLAQQSATLGEPLLMKKLSRGAEAEADRRGIQYLYDGGYDPTAFVDLLERISVREGSKGGVFTKLLAAHPSSASRIRAAQKQIQKDLQARNQYVVQTSEFEGVKARLIEIEHGGPVPWKAVKSPTSLGEPPVLRRPLAHIEPAPDSEGNRAPGVSSRIRK
jgi:predicted Zn-dependent protease